ncbi:unnamed protein product, partial [Oikopleura dioica]
MSIRKIINRVPIMVDFEIGGVLFRTQEKNLQRAPKSLLGDKNLRFALWDERSQVHVVDRNPDYFEAIFVFYQDGVLERPSNIPLERFVEEIKFYGLQKEAIGDDN